MTAVTGLVEAVSFLSLGRVFTANMTGNIVLLAFATTHVSGLSIARSLATLLAFLVAAILGGRVMARANADSQIRFSARAFLLEFAASLLDLSGFVAGDSSLRLVQCSVVSRVAHTR
jgi:uncharacterized membrane protein YoaK (UPF0700 family)